MSLLKALPNFFSRKRSTRVGVGHSFPDVLDLPALRFQVLCNGFNDHPATVSLKLFSDLIELLKGSFKGLETDVRAPTFNLLKAGLVEQRLA